MTETQRSYQGFFGYPEALEGPKVDYQKAKDENPVIRGITLVIGAWLVSKFQFLQKLLWANAGFSSLRKLNLKAYDERWDPTVIPLARKDISKPSNLDMASHPSTLKDLPGRYHSITEYHTLYLKKELTPLSVVQSLLPLICRENDPRSDHSTAFISVDPEAILAAAAASTKRYAEGKALSVFDGVPTAIKDETKVAGYLTTKGCKVNNTFQEVEIETSWPVQKWQEAGGIILGKLNMHEIGADTTNNNPIWGTPRNPHNRQYYTGGSSGGPAYAVAAGLVPMAFGSDGGGSIRIPASFCGVYGLKPSHGRLENTGSTVTVTGPLAASVTDLEACYRLMAQPNPSDAICSRFQRPAAAKTHPKLIGICKPWFNRADPVVLEVCSQAISHFTSKLGYEVVEIDIPHLPSGQSAHAMTILAEMVSRAKDSSMSKNYLDDYSPANKVLLGVGDQTPASDYLLAQQLRNLLMQHLAFLFHKHPGLLIVSPTSPMPAWPIDQEGDLKYGISDANKSIRNMEYVWLANFCGNPAISCPVGYVNPVKGTGKVPIGLMAMGDWGAEDQLLAWGRETEGYLNEVYQGGRQRPDNWEDVIANATARTIGGL